MKIVQIKNQLKHLNVSEHPVFAREFNEKISGTNVYYYCIIIGKVWLFNC